MDVDTVLMRPCPKFPLMCRLLPTYLLSDDSPEGHAVVLMKVGHPGGGRGGGRRLMVLCFASVRGLMVWKAYLLSDDSPKGHAVVLMKVRTYAAPERHAVVLDTIQNRCC